MLTPKPRLPDQSGALKPENLDLTAPPPTHCDHRHQEGTLHPPKSSPPVPSLRLSAGVRGGPIPGRGLELSPLLLEKAVSLCPGLRGLRRAVLTVVRHVRGALTAARQRGVLQQWKEWSWYMLHIRPSERSPFVQSH